MMVNLAHLYYYYYYFLHHLKKIEAGTKVCLFLKCVSSPRCSFLPIPKCVPSSVISSLPRTMRSL